MQDESKPLFILDENLSSPSLVHDFVQVQTKIYDAGAFAAAIAVPMNEKSKVRKTAFWPIWVSERERERERESSSSSQSIAGRPGPDPDPTRTRPVGPGLTPNPTRQV